MEKLIDALVANAAANVAVLALAIMVAILLGLLKKQGEDHRQESDKLSHALNAIADAVQALRLDMAQRAGGRK